MQDSQQSSSSNQQWLENERQRAAATRSFTSAAVLTLVLYFVLWLPGLIANIVYWNEARKIERMIGRAPEGKGCLTAMLVVFIVLPAAGLVLLFMFGGLAALTSHP